MTHTAWFPTAGAEVKAPTVTLTYTQLPRGPWGPKVSTERKGCGKAPGRCGRGPSQHRTTLSLNPLPEIPVSPTLAPGDRRHLKVGRKEEVQEIPRFGRDRSGRSQDGEMVLAIPFPALSLLTWTQAAHVSSLCSQAEESCPAKPRTLSAITIS